MAPVSRAEPAPPERAQKKNRLGGQRKRLKRLDSDKGIQGNQSLFF
jgi:hypothetical protein